jgi:hypothetical protein
MSVLKITPWPDPVLDHLGHDPRSSYVETFWLAILGPSTTFLLRRLADRFDAEPDGFVLDLDETARSLGLGIRSGRHAPFQRALDRCVVFGLARQPFSATLAVRRRMPPLARRQLHRLPPSLRQQHDRLLQGRGRTPVAVRPLNHSVAMPKQTVYLPTVG